MRHKHLERDYLDQCHSLIVLGGTFDPIHIGHLAIAEAANRQLKPQRVLFIPSGQSAHKRDRQITCPRHRYNMTALAVCEYPTFDISRLEINRPGPSYTIDTARALSVICPPGAKISFLIGYDALMDILSWKDAKELLQTCDFVVVPRIGYDKNVADHLAETYNAKIHLLDGPLMDISSTNIRERIKTGQAISGLIPSPVEDYIRKHELYASDEAMHACFDTNISPPLDNGIFHFHATQEVLRIRLSPKRFAHTMGVVTTAEKLAAHYNQGIEKARTAALLHDVAKEYSADKERALCRLLGIQLDSVLDANIDLTHSLLGAQLAKRDFHVTDPEILQAIRYHTTGRCGMNMLDKIIMLADYIEPYRGNWGPIKEMRRLALTSINQALILGTEYTLKKDKQAGNPIHQWSYDMLKELKGGEK